MGKSEENKNVDIGVYTTIKKGKRSPLLLETLTLTSTIVHREILTSLDAVLWYV